MLLSRDISTWRHADSVAYELLEEARLRCEQLVAQAETATQRLSLRLVHRELGMAGLLASTELCPDRRLMLLAAAHRRIHEPSAPAGNTTHGLAGTAVRAEHAVGRGLASAGASDHMHLAHVHLLRAADYLAALF